MAAITIGSVISRAGINTALSELPRGAPDIGGTVTQDWLSLITSHGLSGAIRWTQLGDDLYVAQNDSKVIAKVAGADGSVSEWLNAATAWASAPWTAGNGVWFMRGDSANRLCVLFIRQNGTTYQYWARRFDATGAVLEDVTWDAGDSADLAFPYTAAISHDGQYVYDVVLDLSDSRTIRVRRFDLDSAGAETEVANELTYTQSGPDPTDYGPAPGSSGVNAISGTISLGVHDDGAVILAYAVSTLTTSGASAPYTGVGSDAHYLKLYSPRSGSVEFASHVTSPSTPPSGILGFTDQVSDFIATDLTDGGHHGWLFYFDQTALDRFLFEVDLDTLVITDHEQSATPNAGWPLWIYGPRGVCADVVLAADVQGNIYRKRTDTGEWATVYSYSPVGDPGENFVRNLMTAGTATNVVVGLLDTDVFGAWNRNVIYSTNGGSTWIVGGSITHQFGQAYPNLLAVSDDGTAIYYVNATGALGVFRSTDWGANWTKIADEFTATLDDRSVWSKGNHVWWQTRSGTSRLLGRCELDGSNRTSFALPSVTHDQMMGSAIDDVLVCFSSAGVQNIAGNQHIVVTDADGTPSGTQSAQIDAGWAAFPTEDYRGAVVTPISASLVVAKVNNLSGGAPTSPILLYTSASGTGTWTQRVSDPDANGQSSYNGFPATVSPDGTEVWQLLTLPHVWKSINGGVNWTSEDVPGLVDDGQNAWSALAYAHACGLPPGDEEPPTIFPGFSRTQKADAARHHYTRAS